MTSKNVKLQSEIIENLQSIQDIENYNNYMLANVFLSKKSGLFTLDEFIDVLNYKSLKSNSNRNKFKKQLFKKFKQANLFFQHINQETFKFTSYRKILNQLESSKYENNYHKFPIKDILHKRTFMDYVIGVYLLAHTNYSNKQVANHFKISIYRVQLATRRNNEKDFISKKFRLAETLCNSKKEAFELRHKLWNVGISSIIKEKKRMFYVCVYRTNSYDTNLPSHYSRVRKKAEVNSVKKRYSRIDNRSFIIFKLETGRSLKLPLPEEKKSGTIYFNYSKEWSLDNYIKEYAIF